MLNKSTKITKIQNKVYTTSIVQLIKLYTDTKQEVHGVGKQAAYHNAND